MRRLGLVAVASLELMLIVGLSIPSEAMMVKRPLAERVREADYVVAGTVVSRQSRRHPSRAMVWSDFTIRVEEAMKLPGGETAPSTVGVRVPGGRMGRWIVRVSDVPVFEPSQRVILLLRASRVAGLCHVVSGSDGAFRVLRDPVSQQEVVANEAGELLMDVDARRVAPALVAQPSAVTLPRFRQHLRELVNETSR